jgi:DNA-directed RNA polymerase specialized sigma24 family protein
MKDDRCVQFFAKPTNPYHRRYEALRAVVVEGRSLQEVAPAFGYQYSTLRQLLYEFRTHCHQANDAQVASPFFKR